MQPSSSSLPHLLPRGRELSVGGGTDAGTNDPPSNMMREVTEGKGRCPGSSGEGAQTSDGGDSREAFSQGRPLEQGLAEQVETSSGGRKSQKALLWQRQ